MNKFRGSKKHLLDLIDKSGEHLELLNHILGGFVSLRSTAQYCPQGHNQPVEKTIRAFCIDTKLSEIFDYHTFDNWWVPDQFKNPTWDLLSTCSVAEQPGLLLVEAKAHEAELKEDGKKLEPNASAQSQLNHERIAECIIEASDALNRVLHYPVHLSIDEHYQLANRIATTWKLASCGLPVVLLYLGFTGDTYFENDYFRDNVHWQEFMTDHMRRVFPSESTDQRIYCVTAHMAIVVRSLPIRCVSAK